MPKGDRREAPSTHPEDTQDEGRIKRFFCDILRLRVLAYIVSQPPSFLFILSLFALAGCVPPLAAYIKNASQLPDLDAMRYWNVYLGNLASQTFCVLDTSSVQDHGTVGVVIDFIVPLDIVREKGHLVSQLCGSQLKTKIKYKPTGDRIDKNITIRIEIPLSNYSESKCSGNNCPVESCVCITAPKDATLAHKPPVHEDFTFGTKVLNPESGHHRPNSSCNCSAPGDSKRLALSSSDECKNAERTVRPANEKYRHHGLIVIYLSKEDLADAASKVYLATGALVAAGVAFAIAIVCTDRPSKPKPSSE